jgi:hypothetical protein
MGPSSWSVFGCAGSQGVPLPGFQSGALGSARLGRTCRSRGQLRRYCVYVSSFVLAGSVPRRSVDGATPAASLGIKTRWNFSETRCNSGSGRDGAGSMLPRQILWPPGVGGPERAQSRSIGMVLMPLVEAAAQDLRDHERAAVLMDAVRKPRTTDMHSASRG